MFKYFISLQSIAQVSIILIKDNLYVTVTKRFKADLCIKKHHNSTIWKLVPVFSKYDTLWLPDVGAQDCFR